MAISGGLKCFDKSYNLLDDEATATVSTGSVVSDFLIDKNPITYWNSVGSDDTITETIDVRFNSKSITRILLLDHNFKQFTIQYWNGSSYVDFTSVRGLDGTLGGGISETTFAHDTAYYEVAAVTTALIRISVLKTQTANQEKYLSQFIATTELGTLTGYPIVDGLTFDRNIISSKALSGKARIVRGYQSMSVTLKFSPYSASLSADLDLMFTIFDRQDPFLLWLCGGRYGSTYFKYTLRGFRLKDVFQCKISDVISPNYSSGVYTLSPNFDVAISETV